MANRAPDKGNAHVRSASARRDNPETDAADAQRLLNDPAFQKGFDTVRDALITEIEKFKHDGSAENDDYLLEVCRTMRTLRSVRRAISVGVQGQALRVAQLVKEE